MITQQRLALKIQNNSSLLLQLQRLLTSQKQSNRQFQLQLAGATRSLHQANLLRLQLQSQLQNQRQQKEGLRRELERVESQAKAEQSRSESQASMRSEQEAFQAQKRVFQFKIADLEQQLLQSKLQLKNMQITFQVFKAQAQDSCKSAKATQKSLLKERARLAEAVSLLQRSQQLKDEELLRMSQERGSIMQANSTLKKEIEGLRSQILKLKQHHMKEESLFQQLKADLQLQLQQTYLLLQNQQQQTCSAQAAQEQVRKELQEKVQEIEIMSQQAGIAKSNYGKAQKKIEQLEANLKAKSDSQSVRMVISKADQKENIGGRKECDLSREWRRVQEQEARMRRLLALQVNQD